MASMFWHIGDSLLGVVPRQWTTEEIREKLVAQKVAASPDDDLVEQFRRQMARHCPPPVRGIWVFESSSVSLGLLPDTQISKFDLSPRHIGWGMNWRGPVYAPRWVAGMPSIDNPTNQGDNWHRWDDVDAFVEAVLGVFIKAEQEFLDKGGDPLSLMPAEKYMRERRWIAKTMTFDLEVFLPLDEGTIEVKEDIVGWWDMREQFVRYAARPITSTEA